jgi:SAM-dependent methyltransferase
MSNQSPIWDYFQTHAPQSFAGATARLGYLANQVNRGERVLNVGIGSGIFESLARERGAVVHSLDPSEAALDSLRERLGLGENARVGTLAAIPWDEETFDVVVVSEVLEHLDDASLSGALREIARVLRHGGRLSGTVPAAEKLDELRVVCPNCSNVFHRWGHHQSFSKARLTELLSAHLRVDAMIQRPFVAWETLNWKGRIAGLVKLALSSAGSHSSDEKLVFTASRV